ncbi:hypothetical protein [Streptomyces sp. NPDC055400]
MVIDDHRHLLHAKVAAQLHELFPDGSAPMWGVAPGKREVNVSKIKRMRLGDRVFFTGQNKLYLGGTIALTWRNKPMAKQLWDAGENGSSLEYVYALSGIRGFDIPMTEVRQPLAWNPNRNVMAISVLGDDESDTLHSLLILDPKTRDAQRR